MGYAGKLREKQVAQSLRKQGRSYQEILTEVNVSKDTLSRWCREIVLSQSQLERLRKRKIVGSERGRILGARKQQQTRIMITKRLFREGREEVGRLSKRDRLIAGIALYLGDGLKSDKEVGFANSRPEIIYFMVNWFQEFCNVDENKFRGQIWIHENQDEKKARVFWSKITGIPMNQFHKSYIAKNKPDSKKIRKTINKYGVFTVRVYDSEVQRKILGWMAGILGSELV